MKTNIVGKYFNNHYFKRKFWGTKNKIWNIYMD